MMEYRLAGLDDMVAVQRICFLHVSSCGSEIHCNICRVVGAFGMCYDYNGQEPAGWLRCKYFFTRPEGHTLFGHVSHFLLRTENLVHIRRCRTN